MPSASAKILARWGLRLFDSSNRRMPARSRASFQGTPSGAGCERVRPSRALPGGVLAEVLVPDGAGGIFFGADCAGAENIRMKFFSDSKNRRAGLKV